MKRTTAEIDAIVAAFPAKNMAEIAREHGVSRERVRQILAARGITNKTFHKAPKLPPPPKPPQEIEHGTLRGYRAGCRCEPCTAENTAHHRQYQDLNSRGARHAGYKRTPVYRNPSPPLPPRPPRPARPMEGE